MSVLRKSKCHKHFFGVASLLAMISSITASGCANGGVVPVSTDPVPEGAASDYLTRPAELQPPDGFVPAPSGGTVMVSSDKTLALVSDSVTSTIYIVNLTSKQVVKRVALRLSDNPGQCVEGMSRREFFCTLRTGSAVVRILADSAQTEPMQRSYVCNEPRGLAFAKSTESLVVACEGGEVVPVSTGGGLLTRLKPFQVEAGLHDVLIMDGAGGIESEIWLSRKRRAKVIRLALSSGTLLSSVDLASNGTDVVPTTAARLIRESSGKGAVVLHSFGSMKLLSGWGGCVGCDPSLRAIDAHGRLAPTELKLLAPSGEKLSVPLDLAMRDPNSIAVIAAGNRSMSDKPDRRSSVWLGVRSALNQPITLPADAMAVAVAATDTAFLVQTIGRASLWIVDGKRPPEQIVLDPKPQAIRGLELFYASSSSLGMACASCHPDGQDDGHRWQIAVSSEGTINARTLTLQGTLAGRENFRRTGFYPSLQKLVDADLRALNGDQPVADSAELTRWLLSLRGPWTAASGSPEQRATGEAVYQRECASCHGTGKPLGKQTALIGVDSPLVAPFLVDVRNRAPYLRDACAKTLDELFNGDCASAGQEHIVSAKSQADLRQREALKAYLLSR